MRMILSLFIGTLTGTAVAIFTILNLNPATSTSDQMLYVFFIPGLAAIGAAIGVWLENQADKKEAAKNKLPNLPAGAYVFPILPEGLNWNLETYRNGPIEVCRINIYEITTKKILGFRNFGRISREYTAVYNTAEDINYQMKEMALAY